MPRKYGGARPKSKPQKFPDTFFPEESSSSYGSESAESMFCSTINESLQKFKSTMNTFRKAYEKWIRERKDTLSKLEELEKEVHDEQLSFNKTSLFFKEANLHSREMKAISNPNTDFFSSLAVFITDAVDGVNSIAQACSVDKHMKIFGEIMDNDADVTKPLYSVRSKCFDEYRNVENIIRRYHSDTFGATLDKISKSMKTEDMWLDLKRSNGLGNTTQVLEVVDEFFRQVSRVEVFNGICSSIGSYVDSNPAVLNAVESTGKALYGIYDTWGRNRSPNAVSARSISSGVNRALILREKRELTRLRNLTLDENTSQANLETKIREAVEDLEQECREMKNLYERSNYSVSTYTRFGRDTGSNIHNYEFDFL